MRTDTEMTAKADIEEDASVTNSQREWGTNAAPKINWQQRDLKSVSAKSFGAECLSSYLACCQVIGGPVSEMKIDDENMSCSKSCLLSAGEPAFIMTMLFLGWIISILIYTTSSSSELLELYDLNESFTPLMSMFLGGLAIHFLVQCPYAGSAEYKFDGKLSPVRTALYRLLNIGLAIALVVLALQIRSGADHIKDMSNLENLEDEDVQEALTLSLAVFSTCCFDPDEGQIAPVFDCISTNNTKPCYQDVDSFEDFSSSLDFNSTICTLDAEGSNFSSAPVCAPGPKNYLKLLALEIESRFHAVFIIAVFFAIMIVLSATVCFTTALFNPGTCFMCVGLMVFILLIVFTFVSPQF